jgi:hypothetical protein
VRNGEESQVALSHKVSEADVWEALAEIPHVEIPEVSVVDPCGCAVVRRAKWL